MKDRREKPPPYASDREAAHINPDWRIVELIPDGHWLAKVCAKINH